MSVLSRTRTPRTQGKVDVPQPRTNSPTTARAAEGAAPTSRRPFALLAAGVVAAAALGTAVWTVVDDDANPASPSTTVAPGGNADDVLSDLIARETQRDIARGGTFAG